MKNHIEIESVYAREILDSRGTPTVEVELKTVGGVTERAIVPFCMENDNSEVVELRDKDKKRYNCMGVQKAINNVNSVIAKEIIGMNVLDQLMIDKYLNYLDGTNNKSSLGINAILGVSMAVSRVSAKCLNIPLYTYIGGISGNNIPYPMVSLISGGKHIDNNIDINEFMIVPRNVDFFSDRIRICTEIYNSLRDILKQDGIRTVTSELGAFCPNIRDDIEALDFLMRAIDKAGYMDNVGIAINISANEKYKNGEYIFGKRGKSFTTDELIALYKNLAARYPIVEIIDGISKDDDNGRQKLVNELGDKVRNIIIKPHQFGTITETIDMIKLAKAEGYIPIMSSSIGDSEDSFIADFAVALNMKYLSAGGVSRSECLAKYNQLLRIEESVSVLRDKF